jgi:prolipoprotein diacylglyceryl transferase
MPAPLGALLASIPSPSTKQIEIGPLNLRAYGLMIALGVFAAVWLAQKRWQAMGHDPEDFVYVAMRAVPAGLIGARLYHVITDWQRFDNGEWADAFKIWEGGLGIPGGMLAGVLVGVWAAKQRGMPAPDAMDAAAPSLALAQAIGRIGNWFNQELFGEPTDLPWGLKIDVENRPVGYTFDSTFHPTFLYEMLWNLALCAFLLWIDSVRRSDGTRLVRRGYLIAVYVLGYATGRLWVELLRIDEASEIAGVRVNVWTSLVAIVASSAVLVSAHRRGRSDAGVEVAADEGGPADAEFDDADEAEPSEVSVFADLAAIPETDEEIRPSDDPPSDRAPSPPDD